MNSNIIKVLISAAIFIGLQLTAYSLPETIYGTGGKTVNPNGTVKYCPNPPSHLCAKIGYAMSGNSSYPDLLEAYGPTGTLLETREVDIISVGSGNLSVTVDEGPIHGGSINSDVIDIEEEREYYPEH
jgi:hypothetical protein